MIIEDNQVRIYSASCIYIMLLHPCSPLNARLLLRYIVLMHPFPSACYVTTIWPIVQLHIRPKECKYDDVTSELLPGLRTGSLKIPDWLEMDIVSCSWSTLGV